MQVALANHREIDPERCGDNTKGRATHGSGPRNTLNLRADGDLKNCQRNEALRPCPPQSLSAAARP
ncbi:hypothetical protein OKW35_001155 [Paraburkholderia sp. MM5477-R1]